MTDLLAAFYGLLGLNLAAIITGALLARRGLLRATISKPRPRAKPGPLQQTYQLPGRQETWVPWFKVDDSFHSHPKIIKAGNEAVGLFARCGSYAAQHLTDGFVPEEVAMLYGSRELADVLVRAKLWRRVKGGWQMPDYLDYNPSRQAVENERRATADRQRRWRKGHP